MVKRENAITVDIVKAIVIRNYIKLGGHVKKLKWKFLWLARLGSDILQLRLKENTARLDSNFLRVSFSGFGCGCQVYLEPFVPWNFRSRYPGPFLPRTILSFVSRAVPGPITKKEQCLYFTEFFRTVDILLHFICHSRHSTFCFKDHHFTYTMNDVFLRS